MNHQQARRSERLRRKRQATPGLSQPGNYSLFNNAYVVESEASFLPDPPRRTPKSTRQIRYKDSPHVYDTSPPAETTQDPKQNILNRVRVSLFDILSSAARQPVNNTWRAAATNRDEQPEDDVVEEHENHQVTSTVRNLESDFHDAGPKSFKPVLLLLALLIVGMLLLFVLDGIVRSRNDAPPGAWTSIKRKCVAIGPVVRDVSLKSLSMVVSVGRYLWRPAWRGARSESGVITRAEFEEDILPEIMREARNVAAAEVARMTRITGKKSSGGDFGSFVERFAADKDLPADFALASMGASIIWSRPSVWEEYFKFGRKYVEAMFGNGRMTPALPKRAKSILEPSVLPGNCWSFEGNVGEAGIKFGRAMKAESVTMEHTPKGSVVSTSSAPKKFSVKGLVLDGGEVDLGEFEFDAEGGGHLQKFEVKKSDRMLRGVVLKIESNWGGRHTSLYRFRVHGTQIPDDQLPSLG